MRIAVMGAGAVGCYYGAMLARAGHEVTLIGRQQHVQAVKEHGLFLDSQTFQGPVAMEAATDAQAVAGARLVLFCVKSTDTGTAAAAIAQHLAAGAVVLSLQNGVDNAERLRAALKQEVIATVVYVATEMAGPGRVKHHGRGELVMGRSASSQELAAAFDAAAVPVKITENVAVDLWTKLIVNCAYNALSAIAKLPYGRLVQGEGVPAVMRDVVRECLAVAAAAGVAVPAGLADSTPDLARTMPNQYSSTAQDLMRGKPSEIDHLNGYVVRKGEALGVPTPVNRTLHALVRLLESKGR